MTDLRTAAQQALEALEAMNPYPASKEEQRAGALTALRAALAQQEEPVWMHPWPPVRAQQAEPVTEDMKSAVRWAPSSAYWSQRLRELFGPDAREGIDALERRLAEAQQAEPVEPVAWSFEARHIDTAWGSAVSLKHPGREHKYMRNVKPLYLAPPQRQPLTEEEILKAIGWERAEMYMKLTPNFPIEEARKETIKNARAIERAHGIKE